MRQNYKRLLATLVLMSATQTSSMVQAEGIRLVGPSGEVQSSPSYAEEIERALPTPPENTQPARFIGPTGENQTLWSIASQIRPSRSVSVQQTLLAIYRINPQAFDQQNIHELIPGSRLRIPSLEQVQSSTTEQAVAIMKAHEAKLKQPKPVERSASLQRVEQPPKPQPQPQPTQQPAEPQAPVSAEVSSPEPKATVAEEVEPVKASELTVPAPPVKTSPQGEQQVTELKSKLQGTQSELASLEEKNHRLRLMLSEVQNEVQTLKSELNDQERIRSEVEKLLAEERQRAAEQQRLQPSTLDKILSNGWLVGLAALIPGALLAFLVVMLLGRRSKAQEEEQTAEQPAAVDPLAAPIGLAAADELEEELSLDDDLLMDDESDDLTAKDSASELEDDVFAGLEDEELDFNLEGDDGEDPFANIDDDGDLDVGLTEFDASTNGLKVNGEDKAVGLEEMERALDEVPQGFDSFDDPDFDLSDADGSTNDDVFSGSRDESSPSGAAHNEHIDQAALDDLFAELDSDELDLSTDSSLESDVEPLLETNPQASPNQTEQAESLESKDDISDLTDSIDIDENSTDLLDELIDLDNEASDEEFDPLNELESLSGFDGEDIEELDANSVDLLDELIVDETSTEFEGEGSGELDPFDELIREDSASDAAQDEQKEDELLASLGFEDYETEKAPEQPLESQADEPASAHSIDENSEFDPSLDIDALLNEHQPQLVEETPALNEQQEDKPQEKASDERESGEQFEVDSGDNDSSDQQHNEPAAVEEEKEAFTAQEPSLTPTPNTVENEFGIPLEEDWLLDDVEPQAEQKPVATTDDVHDDELNLDEIELPEFGEEDALASMEDEPELPESEPEIAITEAEQEFDLDELELPEFGEEDALASMADEPELPESEPEIATTEAEQEFDLDELELPEFGEEDALVSMADEPELPESEPEIATTEAEQDFDLDELELPEFGEEDALASMAGEPELPESEPETAATEAEQEFDLDELELPEFSEEDALASMADEPELPESETNTVEPSSEEGELNFNDVDLPEFSEEDALASMSDHTSSDAPKVTLQADNDHDALFEVFAQQSGVDAEPESPKNSNETEFDGFAESDMADLLSEQGESDVVESQLDRDIIDSAGMDLESMLDVGEDWNGFKPTTDNATVSEAESIPEDQRDVWGSQEALAQPEIAQENWEQQSELEDFDPKKNQFMTIDELMAQVDQEGGEFEEEDLQLDVGLNEFPDVIGDITDVDVDSDAEAAGKLDLAKMYLEMNDPRGAIKLLEEAIVYGEDETRREAKNLIDTINSR